MSSLQAAGDTYPQHRRVKIPHLRSRRVTRPFYTARIIDLLGLQTHERTNEHWIITLYWLLDREGGRSGPHVHGGDDSKSTGGLPWR